MISITITWQEGTSTERIFEELDPTGQAAINYIAALYPELTPEQRKAIRVHQNGMKCTNSSMLKVEQAVRDSGYVILFPVAAERAQPCCPHCQSFFFIKIGRYPDGKCRVRCFNCERESALTNGEYYTSLVDAAQP